jgi:hypothetical protein
MVPESAVWVFTGTGAAFAAGVFSTRERAELWISDRKLTGTLTAYPVDAGVLDWALSEGLVSESVRLKVKDPKFVASFSSAMQEHHHYEGGLKTG